MEQIPPHPEAPVEESYDDDDFEVDPKLSKKDTKKSVASLAALPSAKQESKRSAAKAASSKQEDDYEENFEEEAAANDEEKYEEDYEEENQESSRVGRIRKLVERGLRQIKIDGEDEDYLMDDRGNIYDTYGNQVAVSG